jgi:aminopeptidase N
MFSCSQNQKQVKLNDGISKELAEFRSENLKDVKFKIHFSIPESIDQQIDANEEISFDLTNLDNDLQIDFRVGKQNLKNVNCNGEEIEILYKNEHVIIPKKYLRSGRNNIRIKFIAGDMSLNRNKEYLYTLFVPDRACTAFPCFDQPDIKARYSLSLEIPQTWMAIANAKDKKILKKQNSLFYQFEESEPISTYLFSFAVGKFQVIEKEHKGKTIKLVHRETDQTKIKNNVDEIFRITTNSLDWLEEYTGVKYPFSQYNLVAIPFFQYGGMEHPGATLYRASKLFLDKQHTQAQKLARANLLAHETAHMWFGDLVTMKWFDDVWLKEVFANFMADKITTPSFPDVNHKLKFIYNHFPSSYKVDRSNGANPIIQRLDNLKDAGSVYGSIIYHKSPIVMQQLENIMGTSNFQKAVREYLKTYYNGNATWNQLVSILDKYTNESLKQWSKVWVYESGMPSYDAEVQYINGEIKSFVIKQNNKSKNIWNQYATVRLFYGSRVEEQKVYLNKKEVQVPKLKGKTSPDFININGKGEAYAYFKYDKKSLNYLNTINISQTIANPNDRGVIYLNLWENMLNCDLGAESLLKTFLKSIEKEDNPLNAKYVLGCISKIYWRYLSKNEMNQNIEQIENTLWKLLLSSSKRKITKDYFNSLVSLATTPISLKKILKIWNKKLEIKGLNLSENDYTQLACNIVIKSPEKFEEITKLQLSRISNLDRKNKFKFIIPSLSNKVQERDEFFKSLLDKKNREQEPWVSEALEYLHHPLRAHESIKYINSSLEVLEEIKSTGDIFFPKSWLDCTFSGHTSQEAIKIVANFLDKRNNYPYDLKLKILQSIDHLKRVKDIRTR